MNQESCKSVGAFSKQQNNLILVVNRIKSSYLCNFEIEYFKSYNKWFILVTAFHEERKNPVEF